MESAIIPLPEILPFNYPDLMPLRQAWFQKFLNESPEDLALRYAPDPVLLGHAFVRGFDELHQVLNKAIRQVVNHYASDERIRDIYRLDPGLETILNACALKPYQPGFYRPDFLFDTNGQLRICEIGARYPLNGWMISYYQQVVCNELYRQADLDHTPIPDQINLMKDLCALFDLKQPVHLIHDLERGTEVFYFKKELQRRGSDLISVKPSDLRLENGQVMAKNQPVTQVLLELDREELRNFDPAVLDHLVQNATVYNDPRTLILLHDKRILAVFWQEDIMLDYLSSDDYAVLRPFLIPSYVLRSDDDPEHFTTPGGNHILKRNSGGRGIDALIQSHCDPELWLQTLRQQGHAFMIQDFVEQQTFASQGEAEFLVAMLLCFNDRHYGPGLMRGSTDAVVNVSGGRARIYPLLYQQHLP